MRALEPNPALRPQSALAFGIELAEASRAAFGAGWLADSGVKVRLEQELHAAASDPPRRRHRPR
jgi:peptide/nickel transport system substrate-binding protein